ncbi:RDD family protein [Porticoccus sp. W117]|uniref:RDD family protein n=1 Tax=Porticoccus sp. W117 TaxID=3054777 RepID=UPI002599BC38|nr:RDD family protein [Porticoccus sp. W117]MDM3871364.1 RDD family protein [Porticoccus sp. W117]
MIDTLRHYETPEGIELKLPLAGPAVRASAWLIDILIRSAIYLIAWWILSFLGKVGRGGFLLMAFLLEWFYPVVFEAIRGATPGKKVMGLLVCQDNGTPLSWSASLLRNLLRVVDFLPFFYGFGLLSTLLNRDFKRLGDLAAGTVVVYAPDKNSEKPLPEQKPLPPPYPLDLTEQQAITNFAERSSSFSDARARELASLLAPMTQAPAEKATNTLHGYAQWLRKGG